MVVKEQPIPDDQWRALAAQNPMRITYPSWRPKSYWEMKAKADPWKPEEQLKYWIRSGRKVRFIRRWATR